jgi:gluconolactonase
MRNILIVLLISYSITAQAQVEKLVAPGAEIKMIADDFKFTEGPAADREGNVYFTDQPNNRILKWSIDGELSTFLDSAGRANGLYFDHQGNLLACADRHNQLWKITPEKEIQVLVEYYNRNLLNGPNDLWVDPENGIYFTDPLYKRSYWAREPVSEQSGEYVYYITPDLSELKTVAVDVVKPNGIIGTPDGKKLYVADIGDKKTYVYEIEEDGSLSNRKLFAEMGSDGMTIDNKGNIYITGKGVSVFNKKGKKLGNIPVDARWTANVTFGGKDQQTLFITASEYLYALKMKVKGVRY